MDDERAKARNEFDRLLKAIEAGAPDAIQMAVDLIRRRIEDMYRSASHVPPEPADQAADPENTPAALSDESQLIRSRINEMNRLLRSAAHEKMNDERRIRPDHTWFTRDLQSEAVQRVLATLKRDPNLADKLKQPAFLFTSLTNEMFRALQDHHRKRKAAKRGAGWKKQSAEALDRRAAAGEPLDGLLALEERLERLAREAPRSFSVFLYRFVGCLSFEEIGKLLGINAGKAEDLWKSVQVFLAADDRAGGKPSRRPSGSD
jgi:DNA-directed RNA polymerase specialized sigma24 family protein